MDDEHLGMHLLRHQQTIARPAVVSGIGYWSGRDVRVEFRPGATGTGIVFVRSDLPGCPRIPAGVENRQETPRRTTLASGEAEGEMIEHVMAALAGLRIDNCEIWVSQPELPGCDGSSQPFVAALDLAGIVPQAEPRPCIEVRQVLRLGNQESWIEVRPCPGGKTVLHYELDYGGGTAIGRQSLEVTLSPEVFRKGLAASRTFVLEHEAAAMVDAGRGLRTTFRDLLVFGRDGVIGNQLRFPDECVRHKLLDMIGDLALAGCDLAGHFVAYRSGHRLNARLVRALLTAGCRHEQRQRCA